MDRSNTSTEEGSALVPRGGALPLAPPAWERFYLDEMSPPHPGGLTGWLAWWKRVQNARQLGDEIFAEIQGAFQEALLTRYKLALRMDEAIIEEHNYLRLAKAKLVIEDFIAREKDRRMISRRLQMVRQLLGIQVTLTKMGVPKDTVDRKIAQYVERLIDAVGIEVTAGGSDENDER